jgi:hypothetical protein
MNLDLADIVGFTGMAAMVIAYGYSNLSKSLNLILFNLLNLAGAVAMIASLSVHPNKAAMLLEIVWAAIALFGLVKALLARAPA